MNWGMWKEAVLAYLREVFWHFPADVVEYHEDLSILAAKVVEIRIPRMLLSEHESVPLQLSHLYGDSKTLTGTRKGEDERVSIAS
jgi:hypothetical protein